VLKDTQTQQSPLLVEHFKELFGVRGSQQVVETVADSLVFLIFTLGVDFVNLNLAWALGTPIGSIVSVVVFFFS
jgi:hypothetical protein